MTAVLLLWFAWFLGFILGYAALAKTIKMQQFETQVESVSGLTTPLAWALTLATLTSEYALAGLLLAGMETSTVFFAAAGLLGVFTLFVGWVVRTGKKVSCYCFGEQDADISPLTLWRNLTLLGVAVLGGALSFYQDAACSWPECIVPMSAGLSSGLLFLTAYNLGILWRLSRDFV